MTVHRARSKFGCPIHARTVPRSRIVKLQSAHSPKKIFLRFPHKTGMSIPHQPANSSNPNIHAPFPSKNSWHTSYGPLGIIKSVTKQEPGRPAGLFFVLKPLHPEGCIGSDSRPQGILPTGSSGQNPVASYSLRLDRRPAHGFPKSFRRDILQPTQRGINHLRDTKPILSNLSPLKGISCIKSTVRPKSHRPHSRPELPKSPKRTYICIYKGTSFMK